MPHRSHLPLAVVYPDEAAMSVFTLERLTEMLHECDRWFENIETFRKEIETQAGRTEFNVLTRQDIATATDARCRLQHAIDRQQDAMRHELRLSCPSDE